MNGSAVMKTYCAVQDNRGLVGNYGWDKRNKLTGKVSAALWTRHIAEVIRRGFEKAHGVRWPEGTGRSTDCAMNLLGSERLLGTQPRFPDDTSQGDSNYSLAVQSGGSVEGPTEYYAVLEALGDPSLYGVEIVNLLGRIRDRTKTTSPSI